MLAMLTTIVMEYIDAAMVGSLGARASASIGIVSTTVWLFGGLNTSACTGFYVQVAHLIGGNQWREAWLVFRHSFLAVTLFSLLLATVGASISHQLPIWLGGETAIQSDAAIYFLIFALSLPIGALSALCGGMLRSSGNVIIPSVLNILICVLDVVFNFIFIFLLHWGVLGAALGSVAAYIIGALLMICLAIRQMRRLCLPHVSQANGDTLPANFRHQVLGKAAKISAPMALQHLVMCGAQIASTVIVAPLGTIAIAANSFGITVESLCYMPGYGIAEAATTLVGQSLGARRPALARSFGKIALTMGIAIMSFMAVIMYVTAPAVMSLMTPDAAVQSLTVACLRIEAWAEPFFAASIVTYGIFVGTGKTLIPSVMNLASIWLVRITLAAILAATLGLQGVWIAMATELTFRGIIFLLRFRFAKL